MGQGAAPAGVLERKARTRAAPGLRPAATKGCLPGAWLTAAGQAAWTAPESAARRRKEDAANNPGRRKLVWVARREALRVLERERGTKEQWLRHLARHPLIFLRDKEKGLRRTRRRKEYG